MMAALGGLVKILQWNAQGVSTSKEDLLKLVDEHQPMIIAIQETFLADDVAVKIKGFNSYSRQGKFNRRYHGGISTYIHESMPAETIDFITQYQTVIVRVNLKKNRTITVVNIYIPGSATFKPGELNRMIDQLPKPVLIAGDFNAHHTVWGNLNSDRRGRMLEAIITEK